MKTRWGWWMLLLCTAQIASAQPAQDPGATRRPGSPKPWNLYPSGSSPGDRMQPGDILQVGAFMTSPNGKFKVIMQEDCNLVMYQVNKDPTTGAVLSQEPIWSTGTSGGPNSCIFRLLSRGQVVVLQGMNDSKVRWHSSDTYFADPVPPFQLWLLDDPALAVLFEDEFDPAPYTVLWQVRVTRGR